MEIKINWVLLLIPFIYSTSLYAANWKQEINCDDATSGKHLNIVVSGSQFPNVSAILAVCSKQAQEKSFQLSGHYGQSVDASNNKQYYGYLLKFEGQEVGSSSFLEVWIENNKYNGYAVLSNSEITGTMNNETALFFCKSN